MLVIQVVDVPPATHIRREATASDITEARTLKKHNSKTLRWGKTSTAGTEAYVRWLLI